MTKLEEKLTAFGYAPSTYEYSTECTTFVKFFDLYFELHLIADIDDDIVASYVYINDRAVRKQSRIDNLQQAFTQLQKDLEEIKKE